MFISYSRADAATADALSERLLAEGHDIAIDRRDLPFGEEWQRELSELIRGADSTIWLVSTASVASSWCKWELGEAQRLKKRILPVRIDAVDPASLPEALGKLHLLPAVGTFEPQRDMRLLLDAIATDHEWLRHHTRLADRAREWKARGQPGDLLLRGSALDRAEAWSAGTPSPGLEPTHETMELLLQSRDASNRSLRRQRGIAVAISVAAVALTGAAVYGALSASRQSQISDGLRIAAEDRAIATAEQRAVLLAGLADQEQNPTEKVLLALEGWYGPGGGFSGFARIRAFQRTLEDGTVSGAEIPVLGPNEAPDFPALSALIAANLDNLTERRRFGSWDQGKYWDVRAGRLALVHESGEVTIWRLDAGDPVVERRIETSEGADVQSIALSPDGEFLVVISAEGDLVTLDTASGEIHATLRIGRRALSPLVFSDDGRSLAVTASDGRIGIVEFARLRSSSNPQDYPISAIFAGHAGGTYGLALAPGGDRIFSSGQDGRVAAWTLADPAPLWTTDLGTPVTSVAVSAGGSRLVAQLRYGLDGFRVIEAATGEIVFASPERTEVAAAGNAVAASADGQRLLWGDRRGRVFETPLAGGPTLETGCGNAEILQVRHLDAQSFAASNRDGSLCVFDRERPLHPVLSADFGTRGAIDDLHPLDDGNILATSYWGPARILKMPDPAADPAPVAVCRAPLGLGSLALSPSERHAVAYSDHTVCIVDLDTGRVVFRSDDARVGQDGFFFTRDQTFLLATLDGAVVLVSLETGEVAPVEGIAGRVRDPLSLSFEGDLAYANARSGARLWSFADATLTPFDLSDPPASIAYLSSAVDLVVATSPEGEVTFHDRETGRRLDLTATDFPFEAASFAAFSFTVEGAVLGVVGLDQVTSYWSHSRDAEGRLVLAPRADPLGGGGRWEGLVAFAQSGVTIADIASRRPVASVASRYGDLTALRVSRGDVVILRRSHAQDGHYAFHLAPLPPAVVEMTPRYAWDAMLSASSDRVPLDPARLRFLRIERQVNLALRAVDTLEICLAPWQRQRLGLGAEPPCWCADMTYPRRDDWIASLGADPFAEDSSRRCLSSDF
ncbi:toll/interleukin-1 receptor domain-containing protein [Paracoccus aestuarii]|uniref:toll/interleukin-1 receptor domain-containing protein n=1 Tax=Paracoccus aestuarii TaxID=453842 RepID=UPI0014766AEE|nr:toll/interleukin-1 receptor domain-containing protein [Paracoccus aestuarii]WCR00087.1 toll/interleukin-1 receptor domain-containing protein [Paracoccus aestuarii]